MKLIFSAFLLFIAGIGFSQDTIIKLSGEEVNAKVLEIREHEVHYKKAVNIEGPTYVLETHKIKEIRLADGSIETFPDALPPQNNYENNIPNKQVTIQNEQIEIRGANNFYYKGNRLKKKELTLLLAKNGKSEALEMYDQSKTTKTVAYIAGYASAPVIYAGLIVSLFSYSSAPFTIGFIGFNLLQTVNFAGRKMYKAQRIKAVELYNESVKLHPPTEGSDDYYK